MVEEERPSHDQEFVEYVVKSIVDHPDDVAVAREIDEMGVLLTLTVSPEDMGQVIGRQGATAKSIRTLLRVIGAKNNARVNLKINEPEGSERGQENQSNTKEAETPEVAEEVVSEPVVDSHQQGGQAADSKPTQSVEEAIDDLDL